MTDRPEIVVHHENNESVFGWLEKATYDEFEEQFASMSTFVTKVGLTNLLIESNGESITLRDIFERKHKSVDLKLTAKAMASRTSTADTTRPDIKVSVTGTTETNPERASFLGRRPSSPAHSLDVPGGSPVLRTKRGSITKEGGKQFEFMKLMAEKNPSLSPSASASAKNFKGTLTSAEVAKHDREDDCWTILQGRVYDVTEYLRYHPGGKDKLMETAGKDCTDLFLQNHPWVNGPVLLERCFIGMLHGSKDCLSPVKENKATL
eukprot:Filipodium_phascolosomae@DN206_c0_g1_i1.p1